MAHAARNDGRLELRRTDARRPADHVDGRDHVYERRTADRGRRSRRDRSATAGSGRRRQSDPCWRASTDTGGCPVNELVVIERAMTLEPVGDGRTLSGLAVPYGVESEVQDDPSGPRYFEEFAH